MSRRRVVVTGMGMLTPIGNTVASSWSAAIAGESGVVLNPYFDTESFGVKICGATKDFDVAQYMDPKEARRVDGFIQMGMAAGIQAIDDAGIGAHPDDSDRIGVAIGSGIGGIQTIEDTHSTLVNKGPRRVSPFFIPGSVINMISGNLSIRYGYKGPQHCNCDGMHIGYTQYWLWRTHDSARRSRCDGCRRFRVCHIAYLCRWFSFDEGPLHT